MKWLFRTWYLPVAILALASIGLRVLTWPAPRHHSADASMAQAGKMLFEHEFTPNDPLCPGGDGLGPVYNAKSCVACHRQGGLGGSGGIEHNVTTFTIRSENGRDNTMPKEGVVHADAVKYQETLADVHPALPRLSQPALASLVNLPGRPGNQSRTPIPVGVPARRSMEIVTGAVNISRITMPAGVHLSQRNTPALFGAKLIDEIPDRVLIAAARRQRLKWGLAPVEGVEAPVGRLLQVSEGRVGRFGWKGQSASLSDFVRAACANELGLGNPGQAQPRPLGNPSYQAPGLDLTDEQCNQLTAFVASLPRPVERLPDASASRAQAVSGKGLFHSIGCADCHTPDVANVTGVYSDLLLHRMGQELEGGGSYNDPPPELPGQSPSESAQPSEWRTPPLWGVGDSAPYLHDGRAATLEEAIQFHGGQGARAAGRFAQLSPTEQSQLVAFLKTLQAP
jgi:CxxC motif-containing protein (DUF1111 family)